MGAHGGMHQKWHNAYEESLRVPFLVSSPLLPSGARELDIATSHADLLPTMLGLAGIDRDEALARVREGHREAHPLVGRDLSEAVRSAQPSAPQEPVLFMTDDEVSEGSAWTKVSPRRLPGEYGYTKRSHSPITSRRLSPRSTSATRRTS